VQAASLAAANTFALAWGAGGCSCPTPRRSKELGVGLTTLVFRFCQWLNPDCLEYRGGLAFPCSQQRCSQAWPIGSAPRVAHWRIVDGSAGCVLRDRRNWSSCYRTAEKRSLANINPLAVTVARKVAAIQFVFGKGGCEPPQPPLPNSDRDQFSGLPAHWKAQPCWRSPPRVRS